MSSVDAAFWFGETPSWLLCTSARWPSAIRVTHPTSFERVKRLVAERLAELPQLRYRVAEAPYGLDRPWYVDDAPDLNFHSASRRPAHTRGRAELDTSSGACGPRVGPRKAVNGDVVHRTPRRRPGRTADRKIHHCLVDSVSGAA